MHRKVSLRDCWNFVLLGPRDLLLYLICISYPVFVKSFELLPAWYLEWSSKKRAQRAFFRAFNKVPAYKEFINSAIGNDQVPETDKNNYIKAYPIESRCVHGKIPPNDVMIDESSGSTGIPYNWIRLIRERLQSHLFISYFASYCFGTGSWITINAFSMGSWATGFNMGSALQRNSIVKNTGPDIQKIFYTLKFFGNKYPYLITGYPPFLKQVIDSAEQQGFPLKEFQLTALVGGEGMSEGLRDYLLKHFRKVYSGYGATDLEIGIAGEMPVTVAIRRLARDNPKVREKLFGTDSRLPMLFQYNPLMHYIEINEKKEILITITRASILSPRIRYNIHDEGGVMRFDEMAKALAEVGYDIRTLTDEPTKRSINLPFLWIFGRKDFTISIMGANIYPEDIEQAVYSNDRLSRMTKSFCQSLLELPDKSVRPCFYFEIAEEPSEELKTAFSEAILKQLKGCNLDFRKAWEEQPQSLIPEIQLFKIGEGPFKANSDKIKQVRKIN